MTLYYSGADDETNDAEWSPAESGKRQIIENNADYAELTDDGELVLNLDGIDREQKLRTWLDVVLSALQDSEAWDVTDDPETTWIPRDER